MAAMSDSERRKLVGETIRRFREQRGLSRNHVVYDLLDLNGASPMIAIELGRRLPQPRTIRKLAQVLQLTPAEVAELEGLAGYRQETEMPATAQITAVLDQLELELARHPYPAYVIDYQFRYWMVNAATSAIVGGAIALEQIAHQAPTVFDIIFDSRHRIREQLHNINQLEIEQIYRFKLYNQFRRFEGFYRTYVERIRQRNWSPEDFLRFRLLWERTDVLGNIAQQFEVYSVTPRVTVNYGSTSVRFHLFTGDLPWFERLLYVVMYHPDSDTDAEQARTIIKDIPRKCFRLWEIAPEAYASGSVRSE